MFGQTLACLLGLVALGVAEGVSTKAPRRNVAQAKDVAYWIRILEKGDDPLAQEEALEVLGKLGPAARTALPALKRLVDDTSSPLRKKAVMTIFRIDPKADISTAILLDGLKEASKQEKMQCAELLARAAANSATLTKQVLEAFSDLDSETRAALVERLIGMSPSVYPVLEQAFSHKHPQVRAGSLAVAGKMTTQVAKSLPTVQGLLKDPDLGVRLEAARIVWFLDAKNNEKQLTGIFKEAAQNAEVRPSLFVFLRDAQPLLRDSTLFELALQHGPADIRLIAIEGLANNGKSSKELYAPLIEIVRSDMKQRAKALRLMGRICPNEVKQALPDLVSLFEKRQEDPVETELFKLFVQCGKDAVNPLVELVKKDTKGDLSKMHTIHNALSRIGAPAVEPVEKLLDSKEPAHPRVALRILQGMGPTAKPAVPRVVRLLKDPAHGREAVICLGGMGSGARGAAGDLIRLTEANGMPTSRSEVLESLIEIFPAQHELLPVLRKFAMDTAAGAKNRLKALEAVWAWEGDAKSLFPPLKDIFIRQQRNLPTEYWKLLSQLGGETDTLAPQLFAKLKNGGDNEFEIVRLLSEISGRGGYRPSANEIVKLTDIFQEKPRNGNRGHDMHKIYAALALIGFDQEKNKALAVLKEELGKASVPPIEIFDRLSVLEGKVQSLVPELLALAPRLQHGHELLYRALWNIDPKGMKAMQADIEKLMRSPSIHMQAYAELLLRINAKNPDAWKAYEAVLKNPDDILLLGALRSLENLGETAKPLASLVEKHLKHPKITERQAAAVCYWRITGDTEKTVPVLVAALKEQFSWHGGNELKRMGTAAKAAIPELMALAETLNGHSAQMLRNFAFEIDRTAAFEWWAQRDRK